MSSWAEQETARITASHKRAEAKQRTLVHSPLPWSISWAGSACSIRDANGVYVASLGAIIRDHDGQPSEQPVIANATLICSLMNAAAAVVAQEAE